MMQTAVEIGVKIAQARKLKNLSQTDLAGQMSITSQAVGKWERGESMPDIITFGKLASVLGVDPNYFGEGVAAAQPLPAIKPTAVETKKAKADGKSGRDMSSGVWKEADFSGLTGLGRRFNFANILDCKFIDSDLATLTLNGNNLKNNDFSGADFSGSSINASNIENCRFIGCTFADAVIKSSSFMKAAFDGADFTGALFKTSSFNQSTVGGAKWVGTTFQHTALPDLVFDGEMTDCAFEWITRTTRTVFRNVTFRNCFLKNCNLKKARFENCRSDKISLAFLKNSKADISGIEPLE